MLLGACKYFLSDVMPTLSKEHKQQVLARVSAFNMSGFSVKMHGNVCRHYKSFVGRDYKAWAQMAIFILHPYLSSGQKKVLLSLSKVVHDNECFKPLSFIFMQVFHAAYCCHFEPSQAEELRHICQEYVDNCMAHMPELVHKQKTHYLLHLVDCMLDYGPSSAFSAER
jgi:hypothetical protein